MFTKDEIIDYADKLLIGLTDEEVQDILDEFDVIKENMDIIANFDNIESVMPLSYPQDLRLNHLRLDEDSNNMSTSDALLNAPEKYEDVVIVPKVVG